MLANTSGSPTSSRAAYLLAVIITIAILLFLYEGSSRRTPTIAPITRHHDIHILQNMECHVRADEPVMEVSVNSTDISAAVGSTGGTGSDGKIVTSPLSFYSHPFAASTNPSRRAYATTLYGNKYLPGALLLGYTLRKHGMLHPDIAQHMLLLHIPGRLSEDTLELLRSVGWDTVAVDRIPIPEGKPPNPSYNDQYTKLRLF
ncbi:hypothetical protein FRC17_007406, partial [Serendipita sp. 399]